MGILSAWKCWAEWPVSIICLILGKLKSFTTTTVLNLHLSIICVHMFPYHLLAISFTKGQDSKTEAAPFLFLNYIHIDSLVKHPGCPLSAAVTFSSCLLTMPFESMSCLQNAVLAIDQIKKALLVINNHKYKLTLCVSHVWQCPQRTSRHQSRHCLMSPP